MSPSSRTLDASIIICTRNRAPALRRTLDAVGELTIPPGVRHEIVVIDSASTDSTGSVIAAAATRLPIRHLREERPGACRARNAGLAIARGRIILLTDDDCLVAADWLQTGLHLLRETPRQLIGGRIDLADPLDLPITIKTGEQPARLTGATDLLGFVHGCNMIFGRCVVDEIGPFDPALGPGTPCRAADDTDLVYRAFLAGIPVHYRPELRIAHDHGRRDQGAGDRLMRGYRVANGAMAFKHLLRGKTDLARLLYWQMRTERRRGRPGHLTQYVAGAIAYWRSR